MMTRLQKLWKAQVIPLLPSIENKEIGALKRGAYLNNLTLFFSSGTLICCAIPVMLVSLGMGASLVGIIGVFPQLVWLSENKLWIFGLSGLLLAISGYWLWKAQYLPCPADAKLAQACASSRSYSKRVYLISVVTYLVGLFFTFIAPQFLG